VVTSGEYAGNVEIVVMAKLTQHNIIVYSPVKGSTRTIKVDNSDSGRTNQRYPSYNITHVERQHYQGVHSPAWITRQSCLHINPNTFNDQGNSLKDVQLSSTGQYTGDCNSSGQVCGQDVFKKFVELQSGTFTNNINKNTQVLIVGDSPSLPVITHAKKLGILMVSYDLLTIHIWWEITGNVFLSMGECIGEGYHGDINGESRANSKDKKAMVQA
jgi:hypothetical protein